MARLLLPGAVAAIGIAGLAAYAGHRLGFLGITVGAALFAVVNAAIAVGSIVWTALALQTEAAERRRLQEQLERQSLQDAVTGLANRGLFLDQLSRRAALAGRRTSVSFAVCSIEIDDFARIGEQLGRSAADRILADVGALIRDCVRASDVVARLDEGRFGVLLEEIADARDIHVLAERIVSTVPRTLAEMGTDTPVNVSIGIALKSSGVQSPEEMLRDADAALVSAKKSGPGRFELIAYG